MAYAWASLAALKLGRRVICFGMQALAIIDDSFKPVDSASKFFSNFHAIRILEFVCALVVADVDWDLKVGTDVKETAECKARKQRIAAELSNQTFFMHDLNGFFNGSEFALLMFMLLANRSRLLNLFFAREVCS